MKCFSCEVGNLTPILWGAKFTFIDKPIEGLEGMKCDTCDAAPILKDQILRNEAKINAARAADYSQSDRGEECTSDHAAQKLAGWDHCPNCKAWL